MPLTKPLHVTAVLPVWITLSIRKQFTERMQNCPVYFEEVTKPAGKKLLYVELRIDGPYMHPIGTRIEYEAVVEVNALINAPYNEKDTMSLQKLGGVVIAALNEDFCIFKLGDNPPIDTGEFFETMQLLTDDNIEMSNFGQIDTTNKIYQATVEAHYKMRFRNGTI
jgi:hypothetical protein